MNKIYHEFIKNVQSWPNRIAVKDNTRSVTYAELKFISDKIHSRMINNVSKDAVIAVCLNRSVNLLASILSVLKGNNAFLLIDPSLPIDRVTFILQNSNAFQVICSGDTVNLIRVGTTHIINIDVKPDSSDPIQQISESKDTDLAYVVYTSGSTGKPKGVMIDIVSLWNRLNWMRQYLCVAETDVIFHKASLSFDVSIWELLLGITSGSCVYMLKQGDEKSIKEMILSVKEASVTILHFVPSMFLLFIDYVKEHNVKKYLSSVKYIILSGEELHGYLLEKYFELFIERDAPVLLNLYGPAEAAIDVTYYECKRGDVLKDIPIGKEIDGVKIYILDKNNLSCPLNMVGEICISGLAVGRGYINQESLDIEKFCMNPFREGERMYKTGDYGKRAKDGMIYFEGRSDRQLKINGIRIECGEIESVLSKYDGIKRVVVIADDQQSNHQKLIAYYESEYDLNKDSIREHMAKKLPIYMIPSILIRIKKFPETVGGKISHNELAIMRDKMLGESAHYLNELETNIGKIWESVLMTKNISVDMDYFDLGGDSMDAIRISAAIEKIGYKCSMQDIYYYRTIQKLSQSIENEKASNQIVPIANDIDNHRLGEKELNLINVKEIKPGERKSVSENKKNETRIVDEKNIDQKKDVNEIIVDLLKTLRNEETIYMNNLIKSGIKIDYSFTAYEKNFRSYYRKVYFLNRVSFNSTLDIERLADAIDRMVESQGLLRSVIIKSGELTKWREFNGVKISRIPMVDLSPLSQKESDGFIYEVLVKYYADNNKLRAFPFRIVLIKKRLNAYELIYLMDESIHDQYSEILIKKIISGNYQEQTHQPCASFSKYIKTVASGPIKISHKEIATFYNLKEITEQMQKLEGMINSKVRTNPGHFYFSFPLDKLKESRMVLAVELLCCFCEKEFGLQHMPIWMIHNCRSYEMNQFINTIGGFADSIPVLLDVKNIPGSMDHIQLCIKKAVQHHIHFQSLYHSDKINEKFKETQQILRDSIGNVFKTKSVFIFDVNVNSENKSSVEIMTSSGNAEEVVPRWLNGFCFWVKFIEEQVHISIHVPYNFSKKEYTEFFNTQIKRFY